MSHLHEAFYCTNANICTTIQVKYSVTPATSQHTNTAKDMHFNFEVHENIHIYIQRSLFQTNLLLYSKY